MASKAAAYRTELRAILNELPEPELRAARAFLEFLRVKSSDEATLEILSNKTLTEDAIAAQRDLRKRRVSKFVSWSRIRRDV